MGTQGRLDNVTKTGVQVAKPDWFTSMNRFVNIFAMLNVRRSGRSACPFW